MDQRDSQTWVAIELSHLGEEKVQDGSIEASLRSDLGVGDDFPVFVPAATYLRKHRRVTLVLMEGYVFVASGLPDTTYFDLENKAYVSQVLSSKEGRHHMRTVVTVPDKRVAELRLQLRKMITADIPLGASVRATDGPYKNLEGVVRGVDDEHAFVEIRLRSLETVATIPRVLLEVFDPLAEKEDVG